MRRIPSCRDRLARMLVVASLSALAALGVGHDAFAQIPGPEIFHKEPKTPFELWDAVDYLVRTGQVKQALPYLQAFLKSNADDASLLEIRDRYGPGTVLKLDDYPETRPYVAELSQKLNGAVMRKATNPERIKRYVSTLTKTREEQTYAVERLREAGPFAVPYVIDALNTPNLSATDQLLITHNVGRLDRSAVPPLIASLASSNARLVHDVAEALGEIGDARAVPELTYLAASGERGGTVQEAARRAIGRITKLSFDAQRDSPVRVLTQDARKYHVHGVEFPGDPVLIWVWNPTRNVPEPRQVTRSEAEGYLGLRSAREALNLDPSDVPAQVAFVSLAVEKGVERAGYPSYPAGDPSNSYAVALASGPEILGQVLQTAINDRKPDLAAATAQALGNVTDRNVLANGAKPHPLVAALVAPGRRLQLAAAKALVQLEPRRPFAGSSELVPTLARFISNQAAPRAVIIDGNVTRANMLASFTKTLGYEPFVAQTGDAGFRAASESADVELILVDNHLIEGAWRLRDTLSNLKADSRTSSIPTYVFGPRNLEIELNSTLANFPGVKLLVTPTTADLLKQQIAELPKDPSNGEREAYARDAANLLAQVVSRPGSPFESDLTAAEPALAIALNTPPTSLAASSALGDIPDANAQRGLADVLLDPSKPARLRLNSAAQLAKSVQRFGPLVSADQEAKLASTLDQERDPVLRTALASVVGALRPKPAFNGLRLRQYDVPPTPAPPAPGTNPAPEAVPSPPTPEPAPSQGAAEAVPPPADAKP